MKIKIKRSLEIILKLDEGMTCRRNDGNVKKQRKFRKHIFREYA